MISQLSRRILRKAQHKAVKNQKKWAPNLVGVPIFYPANPLCGKSVRVTD